MSRKKRNSGVIKKRVAHFDVHYGKEQKPTESKRGRKRNDKKRKEKKVDIENSEKNSMNNIKESESNKHVKEGSRRPLTSNNNINNNKQPQQNQQYMSLRGLPTEKQWHNGIVDPSKKVEDDKVIVIPITEFQKQQEQKNVQLQQPGGKDNLYENLSIWRKNY